MIQLKATKWNLFELSENQLTEKYLGSISNLSLDSNRADFSFVDSEVSPHKFMNETMIRLKGFMENGFGERLAITVELVGSFKSAYATRHATFEITESKVRYRSECPKRPSIVQGLPLKGFLS